jgi:CheY-like chemotaxis protein
VANQNASRRPVIPVVEDEPLLRLSAVDMLEDGGFEADEAADTTQAVAILERRLDICIVFSDINMPRVGSARA